MDHETIQQLTTSFSQLFIAPWLSSSHFPRQITKATTSFRFHVSNTEGPFLIKYPFTTAIILPHKQWIRRPSAHTKSTRKSPQGKKQQIPFDSHAKMSRGNVFLDGQRRCRLYCGCKLHYSGEGLGVMRMTTVSWMVWLCMNESRQRS